MGGNEECDGTLSCTNETKEYYQNVGDITWDAVSDSSYVTITNNYVYETYSTSGSHNKGLIYYKNGSGDAYTFYLYSGSYPDNPLYDDYTTCNGCAGWTVQYVGNRWALCSRTSYWNYSMADLVLNIKTIATGKLEFEYYGESDAKDNEICKYGSGSTINGYMYDGFVFYLDKNLTYNGTSAFYNVDWAATGKCSTSWNKKTIPSVAAGEHNLMFRYFKNYDYQFGIDKFCISNITFKGNVSTTQDPSDLQCNNCQKTGHCYSRCGDKKVQKKTSCGSTSNCEVVSNAIDEACDDGGDNNNDEWSSSETNKHCNSSCSGYAPYCGDKIENASEKCDTGISYSCYEETSWGSGNDAEDGYNVYKVTCSGCTSRSKSDTCASQTSSQTCDGYKNLGKCADL